MASVFRRRLASQLGWHWEQQLRPRLSGLTDTEYLWEPADGCWSLRAQPDGKIVPDWAFPSPEPPPFDHYRLASGSRRDPCKPYRYLPQLDSPGHHTVRLGNAGRQRAQPVR